MPVSRLVGAAAVAVSVWRSLRAMCSSFSRCCLQCGEVCFLRLFYSVQTVCLAVVCECLGRLCVLCVVKRRRSCVYDVCAVCLSAQRSSLALYVLCRAMLESGRGFDRVSVSLHMLWRCYESKSAFVQCARMSIVCCRVFERI